MQIYIYLNDDEPIDDDYQHGWSATIHVTTDDGRAVESDNTGQGDTPQQAIEDLMAHTENHEILAPIFQAWQTHNQDYVLVCEGLVQNNPGIPVFDLDVIEDAPIEPGDGRIQEALDLRTRMIEYNSVALAEEIERINDYVLMHGNPDQVAQIEDTLVNDAIAKLNQRHDQIASQVKAVDDDLSRLKLARYVTQIARRFPATTQIRFDDWRIFEVEFMGAFDDDGDLVNTLDLRGRVEISSVEAIKELFISDLNKDHLMVSVSKCDDYVNRALAQTRA